MVIYSKAIVQSSLLGIVRLGSRTTRYSRAARLSCLGSDQSIIPSPAILLWRLAFSHRHRVGRRQSVSALLLVSEIYLLSNSSRIVNLDAEVADGALDLGMS